MGAGAGETGAGVCSATGGVGAEGTGVATLGGVGVGFVTSGAAGVGLTASGVGVGVASTGGGGVAAGKASSALPNGVGSGSEGESRRIGAAAS